MRRKLAETLTVNGGLLLEIAPSAERRQAGSRRAFMLFVSRAHEPMPFLREMPGAYCLPARRAIAARQRHPSGLVSEFSAFLAAARQARLSALAWPGDADTHKRRARYWLLRARAARSGTRSSLP